MAWDTTILTPQRTSMLTAKHGLVPTAVTGVAAKKIEVLDFYFNFRDIVWKGKTITVEYDLFRGMIQDWMERDKLTKEEALDLAFSCL